MPLLFRHHRLGNGLDIIAELNADAHSLAAGFFVKTGSRDEPEHLHGVSHFLEHMMFKGSADLSWQEVNRVFDDMGARYNAFTTQELTAYYANVLPEFTDRALRHLSKLLRPALRQEDFDTEKQVILEEIAMYQDDPGQRLYEKLMSEHFAGHPLGRNVIGTTESIRAMTRDGMASYFRERYGPGNMVLCVTGVFDFEHIVGLAEECCGDWPHVNVAREYPPAAPRDHRVETVDPRLQRTYTMALTPGPHATHPSRFAAKVLADVIGDSEGSRLYWALVETAIADDADFGFYPHDGCGSFYLSLATHPRRAEEALQTALAELGRVRDDLADDEVERARNKNASGIVLQAESPLGRLRVLAANWLYTGEYRSTEQDMNELLSIRRDSLLRVLEEFPLRPLTIARLGPPGASVAAGESPDERA
jgi:predicted Zn-dependent peptidase